MRLVATPIRLPLRQAFTISRGSFSEQESVIVELHERGEVGLGEATRHTYYGTSVDSLLRSIESVRSLVEDEAWTTPEELWERLAPRLHDDSFALSAIDQAAHDLHGRLHRTSVYRRVGLDWTTVPETSVTISIGPLVSMIEEMRQWTGWPIFKVKLGTDHDLELMTGLRAETDAVFRIDANCAWGVEETIEKSRELARVGVEFIEQPLPASASESEHERIYHESALPVIADESCRREADVAECARFFHGINVKLSKCGGLTPAFRMLRQARALGLRTMAGCMIESDVAIAAATQLMPLLDDIDLDGSILLADQPFQGVRITRGRIARPEGHGCGVERISGPNHPPTLPHPS